MIWKKWQWRFWNYMVRRVAASEGFPDPITLMSNLRRFAQTSELTAPTELLRAGAVMQARGLINSQAIQHNMDWVWPYWVERQFDPKDESFIPRAFNLAHLNLTHRNWTAVGVPDSSDLSIVDPRGLVTPFFDGWSLDAWVMTPDGFELIPARLKAVRQEFEMIGNPKVRTSSEAMNVTLVSSAESYQVSEVTICQMTFTAFSSTGGWLAVSLRPYNPEGISFIHKISIKNDRRDWEVNDEATIFFDTAPNRCNLSDYWNGDVHAKLPRASEDTVVECRVGMATGVGLFELEPNQIREVRLCVPIQKDAAIKSSPCGQIIPDIKWDENLSGLSRLEIPNKQFQFLYDVAIRSLILHSPLDVYPGPYTYKRFWFRDAAFILQAMLCVGMRRRAERVIDRFSSRQTSDGYFLSQEGEWDSNGEALWIMRRFCELTGRKPKELWKKPIFKAVAWIQAKRNCKKNSSYFGLLPIGISAEHLGPNDYFYWDNFWGVAGLRAGAWFAEQYGDPESATTFSREASEFLACIEKSVGITVKRTQGKLIPASPHRRMDSGAVGSLVAGYPLQLFNLDDEHLLNTAEFLFKECFLDGGFYQEISHSGINPYLTLHIAQVFLRAHDRRYLELMDAIAALASPTGQWPEAIHPRTKGGCMGDGQHLWAAAEWVQMIRNCFVLEEESEKKLVLCSGIPTEWIPRDGQLFFGPTPTGFGEISVTIRRTDQIRISLETHWHAKAPVIEIHFPGRRKVKVPEGQTDVFIDDDVLKDGHGKGL